MTCRRCKHGGARRFGFYGRRRIRRYRCPACRFTFSAPRRRPLRGHYIEVTRAAQMVTLLLEGMSMRAVSRITGAHQGTIVSLLVTVGEKSRRLFNRRVRGIHPGFVRADELWRFVHTKEAHLRPSDSPEWGDAYVWMAIGSETKLVSSYLTAKRDPASAYEFIRDLSDRVAGRFQITTDGLKSYIPAIEERFGAEIDFAQLVKLYGTPDAEGPEWYEPSQVVATVPTPVSGNPDLRHISTSHAERANLSVRAHLRRFSRLAPGFSKSPGHLKAMVHLYMAFFDFCRVHQSLRVTPAMQTGVTDHIWSVGEPLTCSGH